MQLNAQGLPNIFETKVVKRRDEDRKRGVDPDHPSKSKKIVDCRDEHCWLDKYAKRSHDCLAKSASLLPSSPLLNTDEPLHLASEAWFPRRGAHLLESFD